MQDITDDIERTLTNRLDKEVASADIGEIVMEHLRRLDHVAYVRFASVYRQFEDATQFRDIVNLLKRQGGRGKKGNAPPARVSTDGYRKGNAECQKDKRRKKSKAPPPWT